MAKFKRTTSSVKPTGTFDFVRDTLLEIGDWHVRRRNDVVSPWSGKPIFTKVVKKTTKGWKLSIWMTGEHSIKWSVMDKGDAERIIVANNPSGFMTFLSGYIASTTPGQTGTKAKSRFGSTVRATAVRHEVEPRRINDIINELSAQVERTAFTKRGPTF